MANHEVDVGMSAMLAFFMNMPVKVAEVNRCCATMNLCASPWLLPNSAKLHLWDTSHDRCYRGGPVLTGTG